MVEAPDRAAALGRPSYVWRSGQERRLALIRRYVNLEGSRILDVGCAAGRFLEVCRSRGYEPTGLEISSYQVERNLARDPRNRLNIIHGGLESLPSGYEGAFDAVTLWGIEGNFPNILGSFRRVRSLLKPAGICALNWMNFDHWLRPILFGSFRKTFTALSNLNPRSYALLLKMAGLREVKSLPDYQYVSLPKYMALSGRHGILPLVRATGLSGLALRLSTVMGSLSILVASEEA